MDQILQSLVGAGSPFELQRDERGLSIFRHAPATLGDLYARIRKRPQEVPALVLDGIRFTLAELLLAAQAVGSACTRRYGGSTLPRRVAVVLPNGPEFAAALIGITDGSAVAVLVSFDSDVETMKLQIAATGCGLVVTTAELAGMLAGMAGCPCLALAWNDLGALEPPDRNPERIRPVPESEALIAFTSGSSGQPKPVVISHRALLTGLWNMLLAGAWTAQRNRRLDGSQAAVRPAGGTPCSLLVAPLSHVSGYSHLLLSLAMSGRVVLMSHWDAATAAAVACSEEVRSLVGATPRMMLDLLDVPLGGDRRIPIESFGVHGAALRRGLMDEIRKKVPDARFSTGYGLTETNGSIASTSGPELAAMPHTCGPVLPTVDIQIVGDHGQVQPPGRPGEIRVRGAMLFDRYLVAERAARPGETPEWFATGDIGVLDENRFLTLLERGSDTIKAGVRGLYCSEIEKYLDDGQWGDEVVAVGTHDGQRLLVGVVSRRQDLDSCKLKRRIEQDFHLPAKAITVVCRPELPRTSSGKIDRRALAALFPDHVS